VIDAHVARLAGLGVGWEALDRDLQRHGLPQLGACLTTADAWAVAAHLDVIAHTTQEATAP
jgi:hypothetical protein